VTASSRRGQTTTSRFEDGEHTLIIKDKKFYNKKFNNKNFSQKNGFTNSSLTELILANIEQINQKKIDASQILSRHMSRIYVGTQRIIKYGTS